MKRRTMFGVIICAVSILGVASRVFSASTHPKVISSSGQVRASIYDGLASTDWGRSNVLGPGSAQGCAAGRDATVKQAMFTCYGETCMGHYMSYDQASPCAGDPSCPVGVAYYGGESSFYTDGRESDPRDCGGVSCCDNTVRCENNNPY